MSDTEILNQILEKLNNLQQGQNLLAKHVNDLSTGQQEIRQSQLTEKVRVLFDVCEVINDDNKNIINSLNRIEAKIDVLQMEAANIRRVTDKVVV